MKELNVPKYHHSRLPVPGRGNLVVRRYVPPHGVRYGVSLLSSSDDVEHIGIEGRWIKWKRWKKRRDLLE